jgi:flagellar hook-basal body complex protein FliE
MALDIASISSALAPNSAAKLAELARTNALHYTANGVAGILDDGSGEDSSLDPLAGLPLGGTASSGASTGATSFEDALLKAMDGVSASQAKSDGLLQKVVADPNSVDAQDVTIAMAEANMSLNLAKTILSRIVTAWKDVINTR